MPARAAQQLVQTSKGRAGTRLPPSKTVLSRPAPQGKAVRKHEHFVWLDGQCDYKYLIHTAGFSYSGGTGGWRMLLRARRAASHVQSRSSQPACLQSC